MGESNPPMTSAAAAESQGAINIVNSDGSLNVQGAIVLALVGIGFVLAFVFGVGVLVWLLNQVRRTH